MKTLPGGIFRHRKGKCRGADSRARLRTSARNRLTIKTYKPIASVAAVSDRHAGWQWLRNKFSGAMPLNLSLRGGRRPTWRPEREARGSALGVQSRSTRSECGKAIGEIAAAFPRLPRPLRGLAMTSREPLLFYRQPAPVAGAEPGPAVHSPAMADGEKNSPSGAW